MKIFGIQITIHRHVFVKKILAQYEVFGNNYEIKVGEKCVKPNCQYGAYKNVYYIKCAKNPEAYLVE